MKIAKYIFLLQASVRMASKRLGLEKPLKESELFVLYAIDYIPFPPAQRHIVSHAKEMGYKITPLTIAIALMSLTSSELITIDKKRYTISWKGREFISYVRRYLLHKRL